MKKCLSIILAFILALTPMTALAANNGPSEETFDNQYLAFIRCIDLSKEKSIVDVFGDNHVNNGAIDGVTYDREKNTLSLESVNNPQLRISTNMMGDDFKLHVNGNCVLRDLYVFGYEWGGSLNITGSGTLTLNKDKESDYAINMEAEGTEGKLHLDRSVSLNAYGKENAVSINASSNRDITSAITIGEKGVQGVIGEGRTDERPVTIPGAEKDETEYTIGYKVKRASDPDGLYIGRKISVFMEDSSYPVDPYWGAAGYWEDQIQIEKYSFNETLDTYIQDTSFSPVSFKENEMESSEFSFVTELGKKPKTLPSYDADAPLDQDWSYFSYIFTNPKDPQGIYYTGTYIFDEQSQNDVFALTKYTYDSEKDIYIPGDSERITRGEFEKRGYSMVMDGDEEKTILWYDKEDDSYNNIGYLVNIPGSDDVYALNMSMSEDINVSYLYRRLIWNKDHNRYEVDPEFGDAFCTKEEFNENGFEYVYEEGPVEFVNKEVYLRSYNVYKDANGKRYAVDWADHVYNYTEDLKVQVNGKEYYIVSPVNDEQISISDLKEVSERVDTGLYNYKLNKKEWIVAGSSEKETLKKMDIGNVWQELSPHIGIAFTTAFDPDGILDSKMEFKDQYWTDSETGDEIHVGQSKVPKVGHKYKFTVVISPKSGYSFDNQKFDEFIYGGNLVDPEDYTKTLNADGSITLFWGIESVCKPDDFTNKDFGLIVEMPKAFTYTGSAIKPRPNVYTTMQGAIVRLEKGTDYTLEYRSNKLIGTGYVKVKGIGSFTGAKTISFKINPKGASIKTVKAGKRRLTVTWSQKKGIAGYHIQYATNKEFKSAKKITVKGKTSKTITGLRSGKTYYVRVRTFKGKNVSSWSKAKYVKIK